MIDATLGHIPYLSGLFGGGRFVQTVLIEDMSHCYDIFGLHNVYLDVILGHTPLTSPLISVDQTFRLCLLHTRHSDFAFIWIRCSDFICITFASTTDKTFRLHLLHIRRSDFTFIWIRCSDFIYITFASTVVRLSNFIFCISSV